MSLRRAGFSLRRFSAIFVLGVLLSTIATLFVMFRVVNKRRARTLQQMAKMILHPEQQAGCRHRPRTWMLRDGERTVFFAYNVKTLRSANPNAPPLPSRVVEPLRRGAIRLQSSFPLLRGGGDYVLKISDKGPCSLLYVRWSIMWQGVLFVFVQISAAFIPMLLLCFFLYQRWMLRPFFRRIERIAELAADVGQDETLEAWPSPASDDLGVIETQLRLAHERIQADKAELASKNDVMRRHLADIAHDLLTPITSLQLVLERASRHRATYPDAEISIAMADAVYLEQLTNNLNVATKIEEGLWNSTSLLQALELRSLLEGVQARFSVLAQEQSIALELAFPDAAVWVMAEQLLLERAVSNLVHNALHHNQSGGTVVLWLERTDAQFSLKVMDDGPGVPPEVIPQLSLRHFQHDAARQRRSTGQGLGLAITAEVCRRCDFVLSFEAIEPRGLCAKIIGSTTQP